MARLRWRFPPMVACPNLYLALSIHKPASARTGATCTKVLGLVLDCDLDDWLARIGSGIRAVDLSAEELDGYKPRHRAAVLELLGRAVPGIAPELWDSGQGCYAIYWQAMGQPDYAARIHPHLVDHVNAVAGYTLADPKVRDCCSRLIRVPGSYHVKNPERPVECRIVTTAAATVVSPSLGLAGPRESVPDGMRPPLRLTDHSAGGDRAR